MQFSNSYYQVYVPVMLGKDLLVKEKRALRRQRAGVLKSAGLTDKKFTSNEDGQAAIVAAGLDPQDWNVCETMNLDVPLGGGVMATTYTEHKLTDSQLIRLSQIVNGRPNLFGNALAALERKGLVKRREQPFQVTPTLYGKHCFYNPTDEGREAFKQARLEGW